MPWTGRRGCISTEDDEREWIFYTDVRTFKERYALVGIASCMALHRGCSEQRTLESGLCCQATNDFFWRM